MVKFKKPGPPAVPVKKAVSKATASKRVTDDDDDDDEDAPRTKGTSTKGTKAKGPTLQIPKGSAAWKKQKAATGDWASQYKFKTSPELMLFLEDDQTPFREHWIQRQGKQSWFCYETVGKPCPLCDIGDPARAYSAWNILVLDPKGSHTVEVLKAGVRLTEQLDNFNADPKVGPLTRERRYWTIHKSGTKASTQFLVTPVKDRDIEEDYGVEPLTPEEIAVWKTKLFDADAIIQPPTMKQVKEVAAEISGDDVDDDDEDDD